MTAALKIARGFELPLDLVTEASAFVATRGAGKSSGSAVVVEEAFALDVQSVIFDRTGVYWGLRSNAKGNGPGLPIYVLGGPHGDAPLEPHAGVLIADLVVDTGHSFVLDLSDFSKSAAIRFAADFLERLYDRKARNRSTLLLVMDEAHFYAPQTPRGGFKGDSARLMGALEDVVGLGRSRGLGVVLTTQRTQALNKAILDLIETLFVMRMLSPRARKAVREWIQEKHEDDEQGVIASLDSLPNGTVWIWSPLRGILEKVALRRIKTFNSYATPEPGQAAVEPTVRRELDLTALGEQIRATAERAKENDPKELRAEISQLRSNLAIAERLANERAEMLADMEQQTVEVEKAVEVPVFTDKDREWLKHIAKAFDGLTAQLENVGEQTAEKLSALLARADAVPVVVEQPKKPAPAPPPREQPAPPVPTPRSPVAAPSLDGGLPPSEQKVLDAVAWFEALGVTTPTKQQVGIVAGYKVGKSVGGRYANLLGALRNENGKYEWPSLIYYPGGNVALTEEGRALANDQSLPRDNTAVHEQVLARLDPSEGRILRALIRHWPNEVAREQLAEETGYDPNGAKGGRFANLLGALRTLALIDYPSPGHVVALDVLFPVR